MVDYILIEFMKMMFKCLVNSYGFENVCIPACMIL